VLVRAFGDRYWFGHPLLAEVLVAGMLAGEREAVYAAYARVLDGIGAQADGYELELTTALADAHFGAGHLEDAYRWALEAAEASEVVGAAAETIRLLRRAADLSYRLPDARFEPVQILDRIRVAAAQAGELEQELAAVDDLLALVDRTVEPLRVAWLLARRCDLRLSTGREFAGLADVREAVRLSSQEPGSAEHARAMAGLANAEFWHGIASGPTTAQEAVRLARSCKSPEALSYALTAGVMAKVDFDPEGACIGEAEEAQRSALEARDWWAFVHATFWHANSIDGPACPATLDCQRAGRETLISLGAPHTYVAWLSASEAVGLLHLGRLRECQARLREVFGFSPGPLPDAMARLVAAQLANRQGRRQEAESHLARAEELLVGQSEFVVLETDAVRAEMAVTARDTERVLALVPDMSSDFVAPTSVERLVPLAGRALADRILACHDHGLDAGPARSRFQALRARYPQVLTDGTGGPMYQQQVQAMQAWYDAEFERAEQTATAGAAWLRAADVCQSALLAWDEAYARTRAAQALLPHRGSRREGTAALRRAREIALDLQAVPLLAEIDALATSARVPLEVPAPVNESMPLRMPGLTPREREILTHLVVGRTYAEIAKALVISEKTVSVHVSNLLRKTGTASRVDLAQLVHRTTAQS
jgi:DNA-binding CsgD family transcriptional regulator